MENSQDISPLISRPQTKEEDRRPPCFFLQIPTEIRLMIYSYILPQNENLVFRTEHVGRGYRSLGVKFSRRNTNIPNIPLPFPKASLFRLTQQTRNEAYSILYGENTFTFHTDKGWSVPYHSPKIFQQFVSLECLFHNDYRIDMKHLLEASHLIRKCHLALSDRYTRSCGDLRLWYHDFAGAFQGSENLMELKVEFSTKTYPCAKIQPDPNERMYVLEPLAQLNGIRTVEFLGIDGPFIDKLICVMTSAEKIVVPMLDYETKKYKKMLDTGKRKEIQRSTKKVNEPMYDWEAIDLNDDA